MKGFNQQNCMGLTHSIRLVKTFIGKFNGFSEGKALIEIPKGSQAIQFFGKLQDESLEDARP
jgi:hypothetical protein